MSWMRHVLHLDYFSGTNGYHISIILLSHMHIFRCPFLFIHHISHRSPPRRIQRCHGQEGQRRRPAHPFGLPRKGHLTLLLKDPKTAQTADDEGRLPIHLACRQATSTKVVDRLLIAHHRASKTTDSYGLLPLHWACAQNASEDIVKSLLRANPYAVDHADKWGRTPLSLAEASTNAEKDAVIAAIQQDASYWTTSLTEEVKSLEGKVTKKSEAEKKARAKAKSLEARLVEVTAASSAAAQSFRELKDELEEENTVLKTTVRELDESNKEAEQQIAEMKEKNGEKMARNDDLAERLSKLMVVLSEMEEQRLAVLRITGDWEDSLQKASDLVHLDEEDA